MKQIIKQKIRKESEKKKNKLPNWAASAWPKQADPADQPR
jgi:hypothetical protein